MYYQFNSADRGKEKRRKRINEGEKEEGESGGGREGERKRERALKSTCTSSLITFISLCFPFEIRESLHRMSDVAHTCAHMQIENVKLHGKVLYQFTNNPDSY